MKLVEGRHVDWILASARDVTPNSKPGTNHLVGSVATELSSSNYGSNEWWLLLDQITS